MTSIAFELLKAALAGLTGGTVFVFGQIVQRFLFEPVARMKDIISQIGGDISFYLNLFANPEHAPEEEWRAAKKTFRRHAAILKSCRNAIPFYGRIHRLFLLPYPDDLLAASKKLIWISNARQSTAYPDFTECCEVLYEARKLLGIPSE